MDGCACTACTGVCVHRRVGLGEKAITPVLLLVEQQLIMHFKNIQRLESRHMKRCFRRFNEIDQ